MTKFVSSVMLPDVSIAQMISAGCSSGFASWAIASQAPSSRLTSETPASEAPLPTELAKTPVLPPDPTPLGLPGPLLGPAGPAAVVLPPPQPSKQVGPWVDAEQAARATLKIVIADKTKALIGVSPKQNEVGL